MANRETYPASQSPLQGDIDGPAGATLVTVIGLQGHLISPAAPVDQDTLIFNTITGQWEQTTAGNASITIGTFITTAGEVVSRGRVLSDDYDFLVDNIGLDVVVDWAYGYASEVYMNGVAVLPT